jgi:hypothetical protein
MSILSGAYKCSMIFILLCSVACIDNSVKDINKKVYFNPTYSLPIGPAQITARSIINSYHFHPIDTSTVPDNVGYFWYDSSFYDASPGYVDTLITKNFDFNSLRSKLDIAKSLMFRLNVSNGFPSDILVQLYFGGAGNNLLDSLFDPGYLRIASASVDKDRIVTNPFILKNYDTYFDSTRIARLKLAQFVRLFVRVETQKTDVPYIKLYPDYKVDLDLAFRIELLMNLGDF